MSTYNGWLIVAYPTLTTASGTAVVPSSMEFQANSLVATTTNPFSGKQQVQSWGANYLEGSVSFDGMSLANGQAFMAFLESLNGTANVFTFPSAFCTKYPLELGGGTPTYFRLKGNSPKWSVKEGSVYSCTFEIRQAI